MWMIQSLLSKILAVLFPSSCYGCNKAGYPLCTTCLSHTKKPLSTPHPYILSVFDFQDPLIKKSIHAIKYFHRQDLIEPLAKELAKELTTHYELPTTNCVFVPIPMPILRKYLRGYNQAERIAQELSRHTSIPVNTTLLIRSRTPKRQVMAKNRSSRLHNQHNTFKVVGDATPYTIILVDDVTTTGATLDEARKTLIKHGAKVLLALTLAH
jgi:ComF family protein